ncbi:hypothetical protein [Marivita sp.]|uniref:hypothetical protein n=1 Tax=Marivita sp. TaxID=2003365 RepID=UPI003F727E24
MHFVLRHITFALMVLVIGFTSVQLAAARGQSPAVGTMEICTGTGPVHILVDENGQPTGGVMICPDYALAFYADMTTPMPEARRVDAWHVLWMSQMDVLAAEHPTPQSQARDPPASV